jgi:hypothetical protein
MDEEDILANFPREDEWEAFADHDDLANGSACKSGILF